MGIEFTQASLIALLTLTVLEVILGVDNIVFISILADRCETPKQQQLARRIGLWVGMVIRIILLFFIKWIIEQDKVVLFSIFDQSFTLKSIILILGGLFLLVQSTREIHHKIKSVANQDAHKDKKTVKVSWTSIITSMVFLNIVFSLDSVITAVGTADELWVMIVAVVLSMAVMLLAAEPIATFVNNTPSIKVLALSFLVMIGVSLLAEGFHQHIEKGYIYFAMAFSFVVELINLRYDKLSENNNS